MDRIITADLVEAYSRCRRKAFLLLRGDPQSDPHEFDRAVADRAAAARAKYLAVVDAPNHRTEAQKGQLGSWGYPELSGAGSRSICDALLPVATDKTPARCEPNLLLGTVAIAREHRLRLAFAGTVIGGARGHRPTHGIVVPFNEKPQRVRLAPLYPIIDSIISGLREWNAHLPSDPPPLVLTQHCQTCPFRQLCVKEAEQKDDLGLLERMTPKVMRKYAQRGIFTINQLSYVYRPRRRHKKPANAPAVFNVELQALAIRTGKIYLHESPTIPKNPTELFIDIEGIPDEDYDYLIGLGVCNGEQVKEYSFWADSADTEGNIFKDCLDAAARYPEAPIFHYGSYEPRAFARITKKYGIRCDGLTKRLVNINTAIVGKVYFPARSNRLKDVATLAGAIWANPIGSGLESIGWRWWWEDTHESKYKVGLLAYNRDDVRALRLLTAKLQGLGQPTLGRADVEFANAPKQNATPMGADIHRVLGDILESARSEYRQKRLAIRPPNIADSKLTGLRRGRRAGCSVANERAMPSGVGTVIRVPRTRTCPRHPDLSLTPTEEVKHSLLDLIFTRSGCRKTVVRYAGLRVYGPACRLHYRPPMIRRLMGRTFGHSFEAWVVHQRVALRLPLSAISQTCEDLFSEELAGPTILKFLARFAEEYAPTDRALLRRILDSPFVHADETKINIRGMNQYVWVLTNGNHVVFRRTETRESKLIQTLLEGYTGVLISDFYGGYDAVGCRQQKCLVHLIGDLNDDLWKDAFDRAYESFVGAVRDLLVPIFADIDQYGLKARHLHKHRKRVDRFYIATIERGEFDCEAVATYRKRFSRYRQSLFRFLDEDGLPWNNNTAEQAIRHLAIQRKISGSFSAHGADEYLRLLGISQTCRFQDKSFLRFLLSGAKDVDEYVGRRRRRR